MPILGILATGWSMVRSSRIAQYALIAGVVILAILVYGRSKKKQGVAEAMARAAEAVTKRMEKNREVHNQIKSWPLSERARKLRELSSTG